MASGRLQYVTCSKCGTTVADSSVSCYKCRTPIEAKILRGRMDSGRSGKLSWKSSSSREQTDESSDEGMADMENRHGGRISPCDRTNIGRPGVGAGHRGPASNNMLQFEVTVNRLAAQARELNVAASDSEASRTLHRSKQSSLFSSNQSFISSEDTYEGDTASSWNGEYPGSPHSGGGGVYEASISSEDGYLSRGGSRRTRNNRQRLAQGRIPAGGSTLGGIDATVDRAPRRPSGERFVSDTSGSLGGSRGNHSQVLAGYSSSGSGDLSRYKCGGEEGDGDLSCHAYSFSEELSRSGRPRTKPHSNSHQLQPSMEEGRGRMSVDGLREVNPYGINTAASPTQAPSLGIRLPPPPSHHRPSATASRPIHCCAHCRSETCRAFEQFGVDVCCANGDCSTCSHSCCQLPGSSASGQQCHGKPNPFIPTTTTSSSNAPEKDGQSLKARERKKRYSRPVFGGSNFIACYECDEIVQMPEDFHFSRTRRNKLRCGACSKIIVYRLVDETRILPDTVAVNGKILSDTGVVDGSGNRVSKYTEVGSNHSRSDQISYSDNYSGYSDGVGSAKGRSGSRRRRD